VSYNETDSKSDFYGIKNCKQNPNRDERLCGEKRNYSFASTSSYVTLLFPTDFGALTGQITAGPCRNTMIKRSKCNRKTSIWQEQSGIRISLLQTYFKVRAGSGSCAVLCVRARRRTISNGGRGMQIISKNVLPEEKIGNLREVSWSVEGKSVWIWTKTKQTDSLGFSDRRHLVSHLSRHEISMEHTQNCKKWSELKTRSGKNCAIDKFNSEGQPNICGTSADQSDHAHGALTLLSRNGQGSRTASQDYCYIIIKPHI
jgi:hypothetical protein